MFPKIVREFDDLVVAELFVDSRLGDEVAMEIQALQVRLVGKNSQPSYLVVDPETGTVLREWDYPRGETPEKFRAELDEAKKVFALLRK